MSRRVASGEWTRAFPGVLVVHPGPLTWRQQARAALVYAGAGAALSHRSAAFAHGILPEPGRTVHVSVPAGRRVTAQPGLVVHRRRSMPFASGRLRAVGAEVTVLDLVDALPTADDVVGLVCEVVRAGVRPGVVLLHAEDRRALRHRGLLVGMLGTDGLVDQGVESPLEHRYLRDVERAHGLPPAAAQQRQRVGRRWIRADRVHVGLGVRVELDGQLAHPHGRTDDDVWRDNAVAVERSELTLRYRWRHVVAHPCRTAAQVAAALTARGWQGRPRRCARDCTLTP
ncbi:hypothetical protein ACFO3K_01725 [Cellulomonas algicola]|uniref:DUF559 domain-containing protein n=1 Tax=Cellulomonas algicola TaxID=2071633 RepID=A0A401V1P5_9CELL|nr:hypothetical protein [Cellulomonas algicola]GCD20813.1 hypothetical protein CTKZ_23750 [Cellulomonas algicola]